MTEAIYYADFGIGTRVIIDGDTSLVAIVTAYLYRGAGAQNEISWTHNGTVQSTWIDVWRLSNAP